MYVWCVVIPQPYSTVHWNLTKPVTSQGVRPQERRTPSVAAMIVRVITLVIALALCVQALDVSFIPNDENAPLPLSAKYRESLAKLCKLLDVKGARLPAELQEKRNVLEKMCQKLSKDNANIVASKASSWDMKTVAVTLFSLGGGYLLWNNRRWIKSKFTATRNRIGTDQVSYAGAAPVQEPIQQAARGAAPDAQLQQQRILEAREARLQRFARTAEPSVQ
jgi:hypothetical protein